MAFWKFYEFPFSFSKTTTLCLKSMLNIHVSQLLKDAQYHVSTPTRPAGPTSAIAWNFVKQQLSTNRRVVEEMLNAKSLM